jgi:hypothetical protein
MSEIEMKLLARLESMAKAWAYGNVPQAQKDYDYIRGFCEGANLDFNNVLNGGLQYLLRRCVGIVDSAIYRGYMNGNEAGFMVDRDEEPKFAAI